MLINSEFFSELGKCIGVVQEFAPLEVVCYGIGSLATQISQWQLALILLLNEHIGAPKILAFDPVTTESDILTYTQVGISMIPVNEQAKRKAAIQTLFYMPHCGQVLYENVVSANWSLEQLSRIMLIGNSLQRYLDSQGEVEFAKRSPHINCILPLVLCTEFPNEKLLKLRYGPSRLVPLLAAGREVLL
ncbi:hypothetical protein GGI25_000882 [Coemansia spiralis]|uniref:SRR1-like domain-containing protein n=2 Tax=Coemansia TaxID=4863 RepID=A0A9W8L0Q9_9FUNG|nr:hypothetical protein EDC05_001751 [Coemansia umbellata]KAJ2623619.1 hypothetical protein GGI26_002257 [Coemansia sp. RSA 1358]KAJ2680289.1 hypothetical protein GGI25_000882 [Coemansia spiralis]